jgi:hypothetical protein
MLRNRRKGKVPRTLSPRVHEESREGDLLRPRKAQEGAGRSGVVVLESQPVTAKAAKGRSEQVSRHDSTSDATNLCLYLANKSAAVECGRSDGERKKTCDEDLMIIGGRGDRRGRV